jgi:hypothetical protein
MRLGGARAGEDDRPTPTAADGDARDAAREPLP